MIDGEPSRTAMMTALARGLHRLFDDRPWLVDDPFGLLLIGPDWRSAGGAAAAAYDETERARLRAFIVARQKFAEDRLIAGRYPQYVMLGAGLDSFVWRRPDVARHTRIFEIDHPATQNFKRTRADALGLTLPRTHSYTAVDFERETVQQALDRAGFDWSLPAFFTWIGVTMYISRAASRAVFSTVANCAEGSEIVFTYAPSANELDADDRKLRDIFVGIAAAAGESAISEFSQFELAELVAETGLTLAANPTRQDVAQAYFVDRNDGLAPHGMERVAAARTVKRAH
ncbi:MAG: class I SAM-dependent methyltransferase [Parvularculaceae bacterium]|nr:class I SAM-dependent methyltransferase [Parvularculaceae bacterium]